MNSTDQQQEFTKVADILDSTGGTMTVLSFLFGALIIAINSILTWFLRTKFRREVNSLFIVISHLCFADLLNGLVS